MNRILVVISTVFLILACSGKALVHKVPADSEPEVAVCKDCHVSFDEVLPNSHPAVSGNDIRACIGCHKSMASKKAAPNGFSARLHRSHAKEESSLECTACHSWLPGRNFGLPGTDIGFGPASEKDMTLLKKTTFSWAGSHYLDALHAQQNISCNGCHGDVLPSQGDTVENERCLACHGTYDTLAEKTTPKIFPDRNPHKSHLGVINCTVCHFAHSESRVYCLECHPKFEMRTPDLRF